MDETAIYTVREAAAILKVSPKTLYRQVEAGLIPSARVGRQIRFLGWALNDWLKGGIGGTKAGGV